MRLVVWFCAHIVRVDASKACRVQVDEQVKVDDNLMHEMIRKDFGGCAVFVPWKGAVEVMFIAELARVVEVTWHIHTGNRHNGATQVLHVNFIDDSMDARHAVQFIPMHSCCDP